MNFGVEMSKIYKIAYYLIGIILIALIVKIVKITFFEHEEFDLITQFMPIKKQNSYQSIELGKGKDEIIYEKGYPNYVYVEITDKDDERVPKFFKEIEPFTYYLHGVTEKELKENNHQYKKYDIWVYKNSASTLGIFFDKNGKINNITCYDGENIQPEEWEKWSALEKNCSIYGITINSTEEYVLKKLGKPTRVELEDTSKVIQYKELNLEIKLEKKKVHFIAIRNDI